MKKPNLQIFNSHFIRYLVFFSVIIWATYAFLIGKQKDIMYDYFIEKPHTYHIRADAMARLINLDFQKRLKNGSINNVEDIIEEYNRPPSFTIDFICDDGTGTLRSVLKGVKDTDLAEADYIYPVRGRKIKGKLLVYNMLTQFKNKFKESEQINKITMVFFIVNTLLLLSILIYREYSAGLVRRQKSTESKRRNAEYRAKHDSMTGLCNQKYFKERLDEQIKKSADLLYPVVLIMCDIDHFKQFNDTYGHLAGDNALKAVATALKTHVRAYDIVARYGGEEFSILFSRS